MKKLNYFILSFGIPIRLDIFTLKTMREPEKVFKRRRLISYMTH